MHLYMKKVTSRHVLFSLGVLFFLMPFYVFLKRMAINSNNAFGFVFEKFDTIYFFVPNKLFDIAYNMCGSAEVTFYKTNFFFCTNLIHILFQTVALCVQILLYYIFAIFLTITIVAFWRFLVRVK